MALRMHPMTASRWNELSASRLPIDLTKQDETEASERGRRIHAEIEKIQAYVDALDTRRATSSR